MTKNSKNFSEVFKAAKEYAWRAGEIVVKERQEKKFTLDFKKQTELVTSVDILVDKFICAEIKRNFPDHKILSEETYNQVDDYSGPLWIIDPIDGTVNFAHGHLHVSVSIAFAYDGVVYAGVVYAPFLKETFAAYKGEGATLNEKKIEVSRKTILKQAIVGTGFPYDRKDIGSMINRVHKILLHCQGIRRLGSAAIDLCWLACGRLDGYYETLKPWDMAAGALIAKEAGARVGHIVKNDAHVPEDLWSKHIVAANSNIFDDLIELIK